MTLAAVVVPLAAYTVVFQTLVYLVLPARLRAQLAPVAVGMVGAGLVTAAGLIFGLDAIGLAAPALWATAAWGSAAVALVSIMGAVMLSRDELRTQLVDPRIAELTTSRALGQIFVRIPVFTALIEEAVFRGVLHAALISLMPTPAAIWIGAGLFGLWHIGPGIDQAQASGKAAPAGTLHTVGTVVATTLAGAFLVWLRIETGSIWAPVAVHAGINMTMALFARAAGRSLASA
jgi:membrane protease YdiL (CAAX protease family)